MEQATAIAELEDELEKINGIFALNDILGQHITSDFIKDYYEESNFGYKFFHSEKGSVHMALNYNGEFNEDGYYEQARTINAFIQADKSIKKVLELGSGKGFNTINLAGSNPALSFQGIDFTPDFVEEANKKSKKLTNVKFTMGDFSDLPLLDSSVDLVFEVEAVCHAKDMKKVLEEIYRVLKPGGNFVLFDGFRQPGFTKLNPLLIKASKLVEISMAVEQGHDIDKWIEMAGQIGFKEVVLDDISSAILPNLSRFQRMAKKYYKKKWLAKLILKILPAHLVKNSIAGLLMPLTIAGHAQAYYKIILKKE